jgi:hypothetical protein
MNVSNVPIFKAKSTKEKQESREDAVTHLAIAWFRLMWADNEASADKVCRIGNELVGNRGFVKVLQGLMVESQREEERIGLDQLAKNGRSDHFAEQELSL